MNEDNRKEFYKNFKKYLKYYQSLNLSLSEILNRISKEEKILFSQLKEGAD